jgi:hypothetical protein
MIGFLLLPLDILILGMIFSSLPFLFHAALWIAAAALVCGLLFLIIVFAIQVAQRSTSSPRR